MPVMAYDITSTVMLPETHSVHMIIERPLFHILIENSMQELWAQGILQQLAQGADVYNYLNEWSPQQNKTY